MCLARHSGAPRQECRSPSLSLPAAGLIHRQRCVVPAVRKRCESLRGVHRPIALQFSILSHESPAPSTTTHCDSNDGSTQLRSALARPECSPRGAPDAYGNDCKSRLRATRSARATPTGSATVRCSEHSSNWLATGAGHRWIASGSATVHCIAGRMPKDAGFSPPPDRHSTKCRCCVHGWTPSFKPSPATNCSALRVPEHRYGAVAGVRISAESRPRSAAACSCSDRGTADGIQTESHGPYRH